LDSSSNITAPASRPVDRQELVRRKAAAERLDQELTTAWHVRITGIVRRYLGSDRPDQQAEGRQLLEQIRDPLALQPLIRILGASEAAAVRTTLADLLARFSADDASLQLTVMALTDPDPVVRGTAARQLGYSGDQRAAAVVEAALRCGHEPIINAAAGALRAMPRMAIEPLIDALVAVQRTDLQADKAVKAFLGQWKHTWSYSIRPQLAPGTLAPRDAGLADEMRWLQRAPGVQGDPPAAEPAVFRTSVMEALRALTGADFGFDQRRWRQWWAVERNRRKLLPKLNE